MVFFLFLFLFGLAIGSFLNVLIDRLPGGESVVKGRSYCDHCKKPLLWYDLVPLVSFFLLGGKCRRCRSPISFYYPVVEVTTGLLFVGVLFFLGGFTINIITIIYIIYYLFVLSCFIVIFFADLKYGIIPDKIVYSSIAVSFLYLLFNIYYLIPHFVTALGCFVFFLVLFLLTKGKGMGFGDVKLVFLLGLFLGWPKVIVAFYIAFLTGAILGCILIVWKKKKLTGGTIPFGPFLVLGTIISFFWGDLILSKAMQALHW